MSIVYIFFIIFFLEKKMVDATFQYFKDYYENHFADLDSPGSYDAFGVGKRSRMFIPDLHHHARMEHFAQVFVIQEMRRIFKGSFKKQQLQFTRSWLWNMSRIVEKKGGFDDLFSGVYETSIKFMISAHYGKDIYTSQNFDVKEYVYSVKTLCQMILLTTFGVSALFDWDMLSSIDRGLETTYETEEESSFARCAVYKAIVNHQDRIRYPLPSEIGRVLPPILANMKKSLFVQLKESNDVLQGLTDDRRDIESGSPEAHVLSIITQVPLREFIFRHSPQSHIFMFWYDEYLRYGGNENTISRNDMASVIMQCRPHFMEAFQDSVVVWHREMEKCYEHVLTSSNMSFEEIGKTLVKWYSTFDFSRGFGNIVSNKTRFEIFNLNRELCFPDPLLFFINRLLFGKMIPEKEKWMKCRFEVHSCKHSDLLSCEHETRLMQFIIWLASLRNPCDLAAQSIRMVMSLLTCMNFGTENIYGLKFMHIRETNFAQRISVIERQSWYNVILSTLQSAERSTLSASMETTEESQLLFSHIRNRLQPFMAELFGACSSSFVEQMELTAFDRKLAFLLNVRNMFPSILIRALQSHDCLSVSKPLFENWRTQVFIRLTRGSTYHYLITQLWEFAIKYGHTWLCQDLFQNGFPAFFDTVDPHDYEERYRSLTFPLLVKRSVKTNNFFNPMLRYADFDFSNFDAIPVAKRWLGREIREQQGFVDSRPFWAGSPIIEDAKPKPWLADALSLRTVAFVEVVGSSQSAWWKTHNPVAVETHKKGWFERLMLQEFVLLQSVACSWVSEATACIASADSAVLPLRALCIKAIHTNGLIATDDENAVDESGVIVRQNFGTAVVPTVTFLFNYFDAVGKNADETAFPRITKIADRLERQAFACVHDNVREIFKYIYVQYDEYTVWSDTVRETIVRTRPDLMNDLKLIKALFSSNPTRNDWIYGSEETPNFDCMFMPAHTFNSPFANTCLSIHSGYLLHNDWEFPRAIDCDDSHALLIIGQGENGRRTVISIKRNNVVNKPLFSDLHSNEFRNSYKISIESKINKW